MPVKAELSHDIELIDKTLFSIFAIEAALLGECLDCKLGVVSDAFDLVDGGEVALAKFFEGFEHLMKALLIDLLGETKNPGLDDVELRRVEREGILFIIEKFNSNFGGKHIFLNKS